MSKPRVLDACCGQGGTTQGLLDVGFDVDGIDIDDHSARYPGRFILGDAIEYIERYGHLYDAIVAGWPCQPFTIATAGNLPAREKYQRLIEPGREAMRAAGKPYVIENVENAKAHLVDPVMLCGRMFELSTLDEDGHPLVLDRHRLFESNVTITVPAHPRHGTEQVAGVYGGSRRASRTKGETLAQVAPRDRYAARHERKGGYVPRSRQVQERLLGLEPNSMTVKGMQESIPPVYGRWIGRQLLKAIS